MPGDLAAGGGFDGQDALGGDPVPLIDRGPGNAQDGGELGGATNGLGGSGNGVNSQSGLFHGETGKRQLPLSSIKNYGAEGKEPLHIARMDSLGTRLRKAREAANLSQSDIAREFQITRNAVSLWETDVNAPATDKIGRIALLTGVSVEYLLTGKEATNVKPREIPHPLEMPRDVPVLGIAACGEDGAFVFESTTIDYVRRPPRLKGIPDVYAIYVQGSSMSPWRESGETVYVHPKQPVQIGDYVVVQTGGAGKPTAAYIKRLIKRTATEIRLEQFKPAEEIVIPIRRVVSMHRIMNWSELLGL